MGYAVSYVAYNCSLLPTFRDNILVPSSVVMQFSWTTWPLKTGRIVCHKTSVRNYHSALRKIPRERRSQGQPCHLSGRKLHRLLYSRYLFWAPHIPVSRKFSSLWFCKISACYLHSHAMKHTLRNSVSHMIIADPRGLSTGNSTPLPARNGSSCSCMSPHVFMEWSCSKGSAFHLYSSHLSIN